MARDDDLVGRDGWPLTGRAREKAAKERADGVMKRATGRGDTAYDGEYGQGSSPRLSARARSATSR
jgi:hypothetical protein